jgi:hypothetical protein
MKIKVNTIVTGASIFCKLGTVLIAAIAAMDIKIKSIFFIFIV